MQSDAAPHRDQLERLLESSRLSIAASGHLVRAYHATRRGDLAEATEDYQAFEQAQSRVLELAEGPADQQSVAATLVNGLFMYADVLQSQGRREEADDVRSQALAVSNRFLGAAGSAEGERSRVGSLLSQARFNEALVALYTARGYFEVEGDVLKTARVSVDLADLLQWLGDYPRALEAMDQAARVYEHAELRGGLQAVVDFVEKQRIATEIPYYRGLIAKYVGDYEKAERHLNDVLPKYAAAGVGAAIQYQLASVLIRKGEAARGLELAAEIEPQMRAPGMLRPKLAAFLNMQAEGLVELGRTDEAIGALEEGISELDDYFDPDVRWRLEWQYGTALRAANRPIDSIEAYADAIDTVADLRRVPLGYRLDSTYLQDKMPLFREAIAFTAAEGMAPECARFMEVIKSRTLSATLSVVRSDAAGTDDALSEQFASISARLDAIEYQGFSSGSWTRELREDRQELLAERAQLLEQLRFSDPRWHALTEPAPLHIDVLRAALRERNQAVLGLFLHDSKLSAVLLGPEIELTGARELDDDLHARLSEYLHNLEESQPNPLLFDASARLSITAEAIVPEELLSAAVDHDSLIVVPHGELHLLPWAGLEYENKRLFEQCAVGVLPNLTSLLAFAEDPLASPAIALLGPPDYAGLEALIPLERAAHEVAEIELIYEQAGGQVAQPVAGADATEASFWDLAASAKAEHAVLHLSCHGGSEAAEPMNSGLYMADGKVDAAEIARSRLPFAEVVMSACSTGWRPSTVAGVTLVGDDILGLPGAFLEAGVRSVLVSIPKAVEAAAADFVIQYHRHRASGESPLHAYRNAQLAMLEDATHPPALWVGFALYGCR